MALYEVETINPYGGTDFYCSEYDSVQDAIKGFEDDLLHKGYTIVKLFQVIAEGNSESAVNLYS